MVCRTQALTTHVACRRLQVGRAAGLATQQQTRAYSLLDKLSKKAKEAVDKCAGA